MAGGQRPKRLNKSCFLLIVMAAIERFAFKGVASNLVTYLTDVVKMSNSSAAKTVNNWCGFTSMLPLVVASLADCYSNRFSTIIGSSFLYVTGLLALTSTALARSLYPTRNISSSFLFWSLCLISLGQGGYNPSIQAFGADQLDDEVELPCLKDDPKSSQKSLFFQWWYFGVCTGSLLGVTVMSYIQDTFGWVLGFAIPTIAMAMSIGLFWFGSRICRHKQDMTLENKPFHDLIEAIKAGWKLMNCKIALAGNKSKPVELELQEKPLCPENLGNIKTLNENPENHVDLLENIKVVLKLLPIWTTLLMFAVIFQQPATFFTKQGMTLKRNVGNNFRIPPATLQSAITVSIMLLMPLYDSVLIPLMQFITRNKKGISVTQRMGIGMVLSIIAMAIAALVETKRLEIFRKMEVLEPKPETVPLSIFWLLPQYILLGISDIFTVVGMQEFFYSEVPVRMKTMGIALYTSVFGVGSFLSALLITLIEIFTSSPAKQSWFSDDMGDARLDKYYWLLALLGALSLMLYVVLCNCYQSRGDSNGETCK